MANSYLCLFFRYHEHIVEDDIPECTTIKEFKCEQKTRGYTTEEVSEIHAISDNTGLG